jgi:hypothetical protein
LALHSSSKRPACPKENQKKKMTFTIFHNDKKIASFEDEFMESTMEGWETQYVSGTLNVETETLVIYIENRLGKDNKKKRT